MNPNTDLFLLKNKKDKDSIGFVRIQKGRYVMKWQITNIIPIIIFMTVNIAVADDSNKELSDPLKPFEQYIGKTFKGEFANSTSEKPVFDILHYERALNGNGIRAIHSVNDGEYGGESIIMWDADKESLSSWYFTTAGFYTQATIHFEDGNLISTEDVTGNENGITQVKAIVKFLSNGQMHTASKYLMNGKWMDGHEIHYNEAPGEKIIFK